MRDPAAAQEARCPGRLEASRLVQRHTIEYPKYCSLPVIPAKAGIQTWSENLWTPASAGVTEQRIGHFIE
jgi:hypothetical protein